jgi:hypothetical protein
MSGNHILPFLKRIVFLALPFAVTGCLTDYYGEHNANGVALSQAMQASASGSREPLHGSGSSEAHTSVDVDVNVNSTGSGGPDGGVTVMGVSPGDSDFCWQVPMDVAYSVPFNGQFQSLTRFTLTPLCKENDRYSLGFFLGGDIVDLKSGSLAASAIDNIWMFEAGVSYRLYFNRAHAFISPYFSAYLAYQALFWDYRTPVFINGEEVQSDVLEGVGGYAGLGIAFNRNTHFSFFGEAGFGGTAFLDQTVQGFNNDVFDSFGCFTVKAGLCIKF